MARYLAFFVLVVACFGCEQAKRSPAQTHVVSTAEGVRRYRLVVPADTTQELPLMIAWHGIGDTSETFAQYSQLDRLAAEKGFLLAYPDAGGKMWQVPAGQEETVSSGRDVELFERIVSDIASKYQVNRKRIYVVGMSQGAIFAYGLAQQRAGEIAAVVAHSASPPKEIVRNASLPPLLMIVGSEDLACESMQKDYQALKASGAEVKWIEVPGLGHQWSSQHNQEIWQFLEGFPREPQTQQD